MRIGGLLDATLQPQALAVSNFDEMKAICTTFPRNANPQHAIIASSGLGLKGVIVNFSGMVHLSGELGLCRMKFPENLAPTARFGVG
jgi:hypothetical protein